MRKVEFDRTAFPAAQNRPLSLEERLAPKLDEAEYLLILVLGFMLWTAGFVDLFTHTSGDPVVLGLYSLPYFILLLAYSLGFVFWGWLIVARDSLSWFKRGLSAIQRSWAWTAGWFLFVAFLLASMFVWDRWVSFPLLEASMALLALLMSAAILLARPVPGEKAQPAVRLFSFLIAGVLIIEALLQILAFFRLIPISNLSGLFTHYGRVYQIEEGYANTTVNRLGWYYPEFRLEEGSRRIVLTGDSFVQGLQVKKEENLGVALQGLLNGQAGQGESTASAGAWTEVLALGLPGYGPGLYLDTLLYPYTLDPVQPAEVVVFFHLANDFQTITSPNQHIPFYTVKENAQVAIHEDDFNLRHNIQHLIIRGLEPINPVRTVASHLFLFSFLDRFLQDRAGIVSPAAAQQPNIDRARTQDPLGASSFVFKVEPGPEAEHALTIATGLLKSFKDELDRHGVKMRLVTIPYFPVDFYRQDQGNGWDSRFGEYDLFLPEGRLKSFAEENGISFLGLGEYLQASGLAPSEIQKLFLKNGTGHFSAEGHAAVAQALYACFYNPTNTCPVVVRH